MKGSAQLLCQIVVVVQLLKGQMVTLIPETK